MSKKLVYFDPIILDMFYGEDDTRSNEYSFPIEIEEVDGVAKKILTPKQYKVFYYLMKGYKPREIAEIIGITRQGVLMRWKLALKKLKKYYQV